MNPSEFANRVIDSCASTNDLARALGEAGYPHGAWVSSRRQEAGRGRLGREWQSLDGNLFLSLVARIDDRRLWSWVPLAAAIGATGALSRRFAGEIDFRVKWPNDLWIGHGANGRKLGGILCEGVSGAQPFIVVGVGMNCAKTPVVADQSVTSLTEVIGREVSADEIRDELRISIERELSALATNGPGPVVLAYETRAAFPKGTRIQWADGEGEVLGLGDSGELLVRDQSGGRSLYAEDVKISAAQKAAYGSLA